LISKNGINHSNISMAMRHLDFFNLICKEEMSCFLRLLGDVWLGCFQQDRFLLFHQHFTLQNPVMAALSVKPERGCKA
jgi:hypothetical protein